MCTAGIMIRKLFILGLVVAACLVLTQGKPTFQAKIEDYAEALIQGNTVVHGIMYIKYITHAHYIIIEAINQSFEELASGNQYNIINALEYSV